jgi:hypothetical protein
MRRLSLLLILVLTSALGVFPGCSPLAFLFPEKPVYVPPGYMVELAKDCRLECWITNEKTGEREKRMVDAQGGWHMLRPRTDFDKPEPKPAEAQPEAEVMPQKWAMAEHDKGGARGSQR